MATPLNPPGGGRLAPSPKQPPHSMEAEQSVLGGLLLNNRAWFDLVGQIAEEDFYTQDHRTIFKAIAELLGANRPCDFVTLSEHLRSQNKLEEAGGLAYLGTLAADTPSAANVRAYAEIVRERSVLRTLIAAGQDIAELGYQPAGRPSSSLIDVAEQQVFAIRQRGSKASSQAKQMPELMDSIELRLETLRSNPSAFAGLPTGFTELDKMTQGMHPGDLIIVGGRPGMGKCLSHDSELVADDGSVVTIGDLYRRRDSGIATLRDDFKLDRAAPSDYVDDGAKPVFEVTTRLGRRVETTAPHPFLTLDGWKPLAELGVGDYVAVPRVLPVFGNAEMRDCEVKLLAYLIGDGGLTGSSPRFTTTNPAIEREFIEAVSQFGGCVCTPYRSRTRAPSFAVVADAVSVGEARMAFATRLETALAGSGRSARAVAAAVGITPGAVSYWTQGRAVPEQGTFRRLCEVLEIRPEQLAPLGLDGARHNGPNAISRWLQQLGLLGHGAGTKAVPAAIFRLPRRQLAIFLNRLFSTDGWATLLASGQSQLGYATICEKLARQVQHLLLRFGIIAKLRLRWVNYREARRPSWQLDITDPRSIREFAGSIGIFGKEPALERVTRALDERRLHGNVDLLPVGIWKLVERAKGGLAWSELARRAGVADSNIHVHRRGLSRERLARFALVLADSRLMALAHSDVYWDRIESITSLGDKQVYDLTMPDTHNFVANDICVHNTSFAMNIAEHVATVEKKPVAVFSMEMSAEQLALRVLSSFGRIDQQRLRSGHLEDHDWSKLVSASGLLRESPLYIDETGSLSPQDLASRARRMAARDPLALIVVDYIQLMQVPSNKENRTNEISEISRSLKALAKELKVPVIALSQLSRSLEARTDKRPIMSDLRESGSIEQDADVVLFVYRDDYHNKGKDVPETGVSEIIIAKQRSGPTGKIKTAFLGQYTRFDNLAPDYASDYQ